MYTTYVFKWQPLTWIIYIRPLLAVHILVVLSSVLRSVISNASELKKWLQPILFPDEILSVHINATSDDSQLSEKVKLVIF
jgi:hypothetical protein